MQEMGRRPLNRKAPETPAKPARLGFSVIGRRRRKSVANRQKAFALPRSKELQGLLDDY
jgi:hypothetical protein